MAGRSENRKNRRRGGSPPKRRPQPASPIITPGKIQLNPPIQIPGPLVESHWLNQQGPGFVQLVSMGGETKLEKLAGKMAGRIASDLISRLEVEHDTDAPIHIIHEKTIAVIADLAVDIASAVLDRCRTEQVGVQDDEEETDDGQQGEASAGSSDNPDTPAEESSIILP